MRAVGAMLAVLALAAPGARAQQTFNEQWNLFALMYNQASGCFPCDSRLLPVRRAAPHPAAFPTLPAEALAHNLLPPSCCCFSCFSAGHHH